MNIRQWREWREKSRRISHRGIDCNSPHIRGRQLRRRSTTSLDTHIWFRVKHEIILRLCTQRPILVLNVGNYLVLVLDLPLLTGDLKSSPAKYAKFRSHPPLAHFKLPQFKVYQPAKVGLRLNLICNLFGNKMPHEGLRSETEGLYLSPLKESVTQSCLERWTNFILWWLLPNILFPRLN